MDDLDFLDTTNLPGITDGYISSAPSLNIASNVPITDISLINDVFLDDLNLTRGTLRAQQEIMIQVAAEFAKTAMTAEHPKVIEALGTFMGHLTSSAKALVDMHKQTKDVIGPTVIQHNQQINAENVFVGTPNDLLNQLGTRQESRKKEAIDIEEIDSDRATD